MIKKLELNFTLCCDPIKETKIKRKSLRRYRVEVKLEPNLTARKQTVTPCHHGGWESLDSFSGNEFDTLFHTTDRLTKWTPIHEIQVTFPPTEIPRDFLSLISISIKIKEKARIELLLLLFHYDLCHCTCE